jgi:ribosomal protein S18 acetylase RimI-like enzyme
VIRAATADDLPRLETLYRDFIQEVPPPSYVDVDVEHELREVAQIVDGDVAVVAEEDDGLVGFALARLRGPRRGFLTDLYVVPAARRNGVGAALVREVAARLAAGGAEVLELQVQIGNRGARAAYERWGFREADLTLSAPLAELEARLEPHARGASFGSIHVQTDDVRAVQSLIAGYVPRLGHSAGTEVTEARSGWIAVYDALADRDRSAQRRLAGEISNTLGTVVVALALEEEAVVRFLLFERGLLVDEYLSVPTYYGSLGKADELSLAANPTLVARLTGADPARVRAVARTASTPAELPPPRELLAEIAALMGLEGAERGYSP